MATRRGPYRKTEARKREIIEAATHVFATSGYHGGSLKDIAEQSGIEGSSILHHFANKEALLEAVLEAKQDQDRAALPAIETLDPADLPSGILELAARNERVPGVIALYAVLSTESTTVDHPSAEYFRRRTEVTRRVFESQFQRMEDAGLLAPGVDAAFAAVSTFTIWDGAQVHWLIEPAAVDVVEILRRHLRLITTVPI